MSVFAICFVFEWPAWKNDCCNQWYWNRRNFKVSNCSSDWVFDKSFL